MSPAGFGPIARPGAARARVVLQAVTLLVLAPVCHAFRANPTERRLSELCAAEDQTIDLSGLTTGDVGASKSGDVLRPFDGVVDHNNGWWASQDDDYMIINLGAEYDLCNVKLMYSRHRNYPNRIQMLKCSGLTVSSCALLGSRQNYAQSDWEPGSYKTIELPLGQNPIQYLGLYQNSFERNPANTDPGYPYWLGLVEWQVTTVAPPQPPARPPNPPRAPPLPPAPPGFTHVMARTTDELVAYIKEYEFCKEYHECLDSFGESYDGSSCNAHKCETNKPCGCEYRIVLECKEYLLTESLFLKTPGGGYRRPPLTIEAEECPDSGRATLNGSGDPAHPVRVLDVSAYSKLTLRRVILTGGYGATYVRRTPRRPRPSPPSPPHQPLSRVHRAAVSRSPITAKFTSRTRTSWAARPNGRAEASGSMETSRLQQY